MISAAVMAHPRRQPFVRELLDRIGEIPVVWDRTDDEWDTGRRALLAFDPAASHHLVIQDDAVPCRDLVVGIDRATTTSGDQPLGLYVGAVSKAPPSFAALTSQALEGGKPWFAATGPHWGVAICLPTAHIPELVAAMDARSDVPNYDARIAKFYANAGIECLYPMPSLVDHRPGPSLYPHRSGDRRAHRFIGADTSALDVDW